MGSAARSPRPPALRSGAGFKGERVYHPTENLLSKDTSACVVVALPRDSGAKHGSSVLLQPGPCMQAVGPPGKGSDRHAGHQRDRPDSAQQTRGARSKH